MGKHLLAESYWNRLHVIDVIVVFDYISSQVNSLLSFICLINIIAKLGSWDLLAAEAVTQESLDQTFGLHNYLVHML